MMVTPRFGITCVSVVMLSCLPTRLHGAEPVVPIDKRLDEIVQWTKANEDTATEQLIDCFLSDEREIKGATLHGRPKEVWEFLRSRTSVEISVSAFALHHLCQNPRRSKELLAKRIHDLDQASRADRSTDWSPKDGFPVLRLLRALAEVHMRQLMRQGAIPETQVVITIKDQVGFVFVIRHSATIIAGHVDHRDEKISQLVSGKTDRGKDQIAVTRRNVVSLADAIRDSNGKAGSP